MKKILTIALFFIFSASYSQSFKAVVFYVKNDGTVNNSNIYYGTKKVSWLDFKGNPDYTVDFEALTSSEIGMNYTLDQTNNYYILNINVYCDFSKPQSYVKPNKKTAYILNHEQHHFDLTYIYTKKFIERLKSASLTPDNYESLMNGIYNEIVFELGKEQELYDKETHHSEIVGKQGEWNKKIESQLASLNNNGNLVSK